MNTAAREHDIVITGLGGLCASGNDLAAIDESVFAGRVGTGPITRFDASNRAVRVAGEVRGFDPDTLGTGRLLPFLDRFSQFALASAREAMRDAALEPGAVPAERLSVVYGSGIGGQDTQDANFHRLYAEGAKRLHPATVPRLIPSAAASHVSIDLGAKGPALVVSSACASSAHAIVNGALLLASGRTDVAVCGGAEAPISPGCLLAWEGLRVLARERCQPFSLGRGGVVIGEGAATLVLERRGQALARGARVRATLAGFGMSSDAGHVVAPDTEGAARAMALALADAGVDAGAVRYVNAHGSGTAQNDAMECAAVRRVFGTDAERLAVSSSKSMFGHALGAASALEALVTVRALERQRLPPTANHETHDPDCDLDVVPNVGRDAELEYALSNSFAFGGLNVSLLLRAEA